MNRAELIGRLGRDPESRKMNNGNSVVSFSLATSEKWRDKNGERQQRTEWHNVVIFNENIGKIATQYLKKGSRCFVSGQIQTREFTDKDGNQRKSTEIVLANFRGEIELLDSKDDRDDGGESRGGGGAPRGGANNGRPMRDAIDDDIPFSCAY